MIDGVLRTRVTVAERQLVIFFEQKTVQYCTRRQKLWSVAWLPGKVMCSSYDIAHSMKSKETEITTRVILDQMVTFLLYIHGLSHIQCNRTVALDAFFKQIVHHPVKIAWIGSGCPVATTPTAEISHHYNITQVQLVHITGHGT